ncbi:unnamed protein product [Leptidea sinapis]|uniref:DUF233 protein n=1 Tax=Leptidea sinapis TaxID=189913 RepID=A0A5E4QVX7_9NEOP|nr:unnamed protein product [Leptidea sinapis]
MPRLFLFPFLVSLCSLLLCGPVCNATPSRSISEILTNTLKETDPLFSDEISGDLSILKFQMFNVTMTGYTNCAIKDTVADLNSLKLHFTADCPTIDMTGKYNISGRLIILPIEGNGDFRLKTGNYYIICDSELKKVQGEDGKNHLSIKNFKLKNEARSQIEFNFQNLFHGNEELSVTLHKFAHENWKEVADLVQDPVWYDAMKKIIKHTNKHLKTVSIEDLKLN